MKENEPDILGMLIRHELVIMELYELFAGMFPERRDFWAGLAGEERGHADFLGTLQSREDFREWFKSSSRLKPQAVKISIEFVGKQIAWARERKFSLIEALSLSRDLEGALLEKQFGIMSGGAPVEIRVVIEKLAADTERHEKVIDGALNEEKRRAH
jgi:rubrerythrin